MAFVRFVLADGAVDGAGAEMRQAMGCRGVSGMIE